MAYTVQNAIDRALQDLNDPTGVTWNATTFMYPRVGDALAEIVKLVPAANQVRQTITLAAFDTVQSVPTGVVRMVKIIRNLGLDGVTLGRVVTLVDEEELDRSDPNWHAAKQRPEIEQWSYDEQTPGYFTVYPPPSEATKIDAVVSLIPALPAQAAALPVADIYFNAIVAYLEHRAWNQVGRSKDDKKAAEAYAQFERSLGLKKQADAEQAPDSRRK